MGFSERMHVILNKTEQEDKIEPVIPNGWRSSQQKTVSLRFACVYRHMPRLHFA